MSEIDSILFFKSDFGQANLSHHLVFKNVWFLKTDDDTLNTFSIVKNHK